MSNIISKPNSKAYDQNYNNIFKKGENMDKQICWNCHNIIEYPIVTTHNTICSKCGAVLSPKPAYLNRLDGGEENESSM